MRNPFFTTGGTLATNSPSYVERQADRDLYEGLLSGEFCYVLTSRQMGKSSLMVRTGLRFREQGIRVAMLDLTSLGQNITAEQWYEGLAEGLGEQLGLEDEVLDYWSQRSGLPPMRRWMSLLKDVVLPAAAAGNQGSGTPDAPEGAPLVIFVDEIDAVLSLPFCTDEFFAAIRECYNRRSSDPTFRQLTFCLLGVATPSDLIRDVRTTPFNIGRRIELTDFTEAEAVPLARGLQREPNSSTSDGSKQNAVSGQAHLLLQRVLYWTGGHPYLTQRLCRAVADVRLVGAAEGVVFRRTAANRCVDAVCRELFLCSQGWERDDNLLFVRDRLLRSGSDLAPLLELLGRIRAGRKVPPDETNPHLDVLRLSGIIRVGGTAKDQGRSYVIRARIYAVVFDGSWIQRHMPDAEVRRQRAAYRRGVARTSIWAAGVVIVMLLLTLTAVDRAKVARHAQDAAGRLNGSLLQSLQAQNTLNKRLETALGDAQREHAKATRAARTALVAGQSEAEHRKTAEHASAAALASGQEALRAKREALDRLSRACIDASTRAAAAGDLLGALPPLADALRLDQDNAAREPIHRIRLANLLHEGPGLRDMWVAGSEVRSLALSTDGTLAAAGSDGGRVHLFQLRGTRKSRELVRGAGNVVSLGFSPDGSRMATVAQGGTAQIWDPASGRPVTPPLAGLGRLKFLAWHPTGRRIAISGEDGAVVWDVKPVRRVCEIRFPGALDCRTAFSSDGRKLAIVSGNHLGWVVNPGTGELLYRLARCFNGTAVSFSPDGSTILLGGAFGNPASYHGGAILDANTGAALRYLEMPGMGLAAEFSRDGRRVVVGDRGGNVQVWDPQTGTSLSPRIRLQQEVTAVTFSPNGRTIAASARDGQVTIRDAVTGAPNCAPLRHGRWVTGLAFSGDGRSVLTSSRDGAARVWALPIRETPHTTDGEGMPGSEDKILQMDHLAGNRWAVGRIRSAGGDGDEVVRVWNSRTGRVQVPGRWRNYAVASEGRWLALASEQGVQLWDAAAGRACGPLHPVNVSRAVVSLQPGGRWLAAFDRGPEGAGGLRVVDLRTGRVANLSDEPVILVHGFFDQGRVLWFLTQRGKVRLWKVDADGKRPIVLTTLPLRESSPLLEHSADGLRMVSVSGVGNFQAWDGSGRATSRELRFDGAHSWAPGRGISIDHQGRRAVMLALGRTGRRNHSVGTVLDLARGTGKRLPGGDAMPMYHSAVFNPRGDRFATYSQDGEIQIWDTQSARPVTGVMHHSTIIQAITFSDDGRRLLTGAVDGTARVWDAATGHGLTPFLPHPTPVVAATFSADGKLLLTRTADRSARVWDAHSGEGVVLPLDLGLPVDHCRFLPGGRRVLAQCGPRVLIRNLTPDTRSIPELARLCLLLAAHQADGNGGLLALEPEQLRAAWASRHRAD